MVTERKDLIYINNVTNNLLSLLNQPAVLLQDSKCSCQSLANTILSYIFMV